MKLFIWDFHGTLEKGTEGAVVEITYQALRERGYHSYTEEALAAIIKKLYGKKWYEILAHLLPDKPAATHLQLQEDCFTIEDRYPDIVTRHIRANDHAREILSQIGTRYDQIVISNTRPSALNMFLHAADLELFFPPEKRFAANAHHPDVQLSKGEIAKRYNESKKFDRIIAIGDSPQDMIPIPGAIHYLYAHPDNPFRECEATYRIRDLREVLREL